MTSVGHKYAFKFKQNFIFAADGVTSHSIQSTRNGMHSTFNVILQCTRDAAHSLILFHFSSINSFFDFFFLQVNVHLISFACRQKKRKQCHRTMHLLLNFAHFLNKIDDRNQTQSVRPIDVRDSTSETYRKRFSLSNFIGK